ncbi:MAG: ABC transporter ATP-binding protein [Pseudomonadota bacterium]
MKTTKALKTSNATFAVSCKGISKAFITKDVEVTALHKVDLDIKTGEFMMLVGPSGCGKTTLISIIAGILKPSTGTCIVEGADLNALTDTELLDFRAKKIGFIFQSFNLIPTLSLLENIAIPLIINGALRDEATTRAEVMLAKMELGAKADRSPTQLSGGEQQRIAIARALVHQPSLLICDEPTSALDHATGTTILELMKDISREMKTTFVIVTHDARIFKYADRIAHMNDGVVTHVE